MRNNKLEDLEKQNRSLLFVLAMSIALNIFMNVAKNKQIESKKNSVEFLQDFNTELIQALEECQNVHSQH